jgi:hypothetical protein
MSILDEIREATSDLPDEFEEGLLIKAGPVTETPLGGFERGEGLEIPIRCQIDDYNDELRAALEIPDTDVRLIVYQRGVEPEDAPTREDSIVIDDVTYRLEHIKRDPAQVYWEIRASPV